MPSFSYEKKTDVPHTEGNVIRGLIGGVGGLVMGALMFNPATAPVGATMAGAAGMGALGGAMPSFLQEGYDLATDPQQTTMVQRDMSLGGQGQQMGSPAQTQSFGPIGGQAPAPWVPGYMEQMTRYA